MILSSPCNVEYVRDGGDRAAKGDSAGGGNLGQHGTEGVLQSGWRTTRHFNSTHKDKITHCIAMDEACTSSVGGQSRRCYLKSDPLGVNGQQGAPGENVDTEAQLLPSPSQTP